MTGLGLSARGKNETQTQAYFSSVSSGMSRVGFSPDELSFSVQQQPK